MITTNRQIKIQTNSFFDFIFNLIAKKLSSKKPTNINTIKWLLDNIDNANDDKNDKLKFAMQDAINLVKAFEGLSLKSYKCQAGVWTIGYGNTLYLKSFANPSQQIITASEAENLLKKDIEKFFDAVVLKVLDVCNSKQIASLTSFAFNVGLKAFANSTLLKVVLKNSNDFDSIKAQFLRWTKINGTEHSNGLFKRRLAEFEFYSS